MLNPNHPADLLTGKAALGPAVAVPNTTCLRCLKDVYVTAGDPSQLGICVECKTFEEDQLIATLDVQAAPRYDKATGRFLKLYDFAPHGFRVVLRR